MPFALLLNMRVRLLLLFLIVYGGIKAQHAPSFQLLPNPAQNRVNVIFQELDMSKVSIQIFSIFGTPVNGFYQQALRNENKVQLYFPDIPEGIYLVRIRSGEFDQTQRLKIQR